MRSGLYGNTSGPKLVPRRSHYSWPTGTGTGCSGSWTSAPSSSVIDSQRQIPISSVVVPPPCSSSPRSLKSRGTFHAAAPDARLPGWSPRPRGSRGSCCGCRRGRRRRTLRRGANRGRARQRPTGRSRCRQMAHRQARTPGAGPTGVLTRPFRPIGTSEVTLRSSGLANCAPFGRAAGTLVPSVPFSPQPLRRSGAVFRPHAIVSKFGIA